jgi:hypothetical protein
MAQASLLRSWDLEIDRGPDWLFVRPVRTGKAAVNAALLAEQVWSILEQHFTHRLVLELGNIGTLDESWLAALESLEKRIQEHDGMMRICGLSTGNVEALRQSRAQRHFPHFRDRESAVMGHIRP